MSETGVLHYFEKRFRQPDECAAKKKERTNARSLSIIEVAATFIVLAVGVATSTLVLILEKT